MRSPLMLALALLTASNFTLSSAVLAADAQLVSAPVTLSTKDLSTEIGSRLMRVREFGFIREEAARLGVKAYLFGGTAAGYAHYVKWDMQREKGDPRFQPNRFDYDYTNIYRSTQDLDIVIDGNEEQAKKLQAALQEKFPHLQGSKTAWEVRLLTQDMGDKQAILNNPDFMNQHTDSNSTGLIEITKPTHGDSVVRDVRDWKSHEPYFLKDIQDGTLHYYFSPSHESTKFAKEGRNPPILSAIRFLTKAFQYELKIKPEDLTRIQKIIREFDPKEIAKNDYVAKWIEKNSKKLIQNAVNIEYAHTTLDRLGLREKLSSIKANPNEQDSLAWWLNKEPLRTKPVGQGTGKTAHELGLDIVAHETNNYLAYESITRAHTGDPNVLTSRQGATGELAVHGDGFYTRIGTKGAVGSGLTIRFHLDPNAREGVDFEKAAEDFVVIKNKAAIRVIPESLSIGPVEYLEMVAAEKMGDESDLGIRERLERKMINRQNSLSAKERETLLKMLENESEKSKPSMTFFASFKKIFPNLFDQMSERTAENLKSLTLKILKNVQSPTGKVPPGLPLAMSFLPKDSAADVIQAFLRLDQIPLASFNSNFDTLFDKYLSKIPPKDFESLYKKLLPKILSMHGPATFGQSSHAPIIHNILMKHAAGISPDLIRPLLRHLGNPEIRYSANRRLLDWEIDHKSRIPWLGEERLHALKTGDEREKRGAMDYFSRQPLTDEVDQLVYQELRSGDKMSAIKFFAQTGSIRPDSERLVFDYLIKNLREIDTASTVALYFKKHPPKDIAIVRDIIDRAEADLSFRYNFTEIVVAAARSNPELTDRITDVRTLGQLNCQTERCLQLYLKALSLDHFSKEQLLSGRLSIDTEVVRYLNPPVDQRIIDAIGKLVIHPSVGEAPKQDAAFYYAKLGGKAPEIRTEALRVMDKYLEKPLAFDKQLSEKQQLRQKLAEGCIVQSLKATLEN
ncbi:MAG: hypothetical protein ACJ763_07695 [Bdellovibrionia bacterium]